MTRERAKELAPIIAAFGEGREVQSKYFSSSDGGWMDSGDPSWRDEYAYRIKPEPKKRPMSYYEAIAVLTPVVLRAKIGEDVTNWDVPWAEKFKNKYFGGLEWATIDKTGKIGEPHAFEIEDDFNV